MSTARRLARLEAIRERRHGVRWHSYVVFENVEATPAEAARRLAEDAKLRQAEEAAKRDGVRLSVFRVIYDGGNPDTEPPRRAGKA